MVNKLEAKILNSLIDSYENSKTFLGENKNQQSFKVVVSKLFPKYEDDSEYEIYKEINSTLENLKQKKFIEFKVERSGKIKSAFLIQDSIQIIYDYLKRTPKVQINNQLIEVWDVFKKEQSFLYEPLLKYIDEQTENLLANKNIQFFVGDFTEYMDILVAVKSILENQSEIYIRELSVKLFNNSKRLEEIESSVRSLLYKYGEYDNKDTVLEEHNIIKTPSYVMVKGKGILHCGQEINLTKIEGDVGLSTQTLKSLSFVELNGADVITIENLTNFHKYQSEDELVIYLGGFHNSVKRDFIKLVSKCNPNTKFKHFGDIDAGGFYILEHLINKTGIDFKPYNMDIHVLEKYKKYWIPLTENDKSRLKVFLSKNSSYNEVIEFMLCNNCKLEQESEILE